jgi:hypothetical protein
MVQDVSCSIHSVLSRYLSANTLPDEVPLIITMIIMACGCCGLCFLNLMYRRENRARAREIASWDESDYAAEATLQKRRGDQKRMFLYGL